MTCFYCDYEWCWLCSATYTDDHFEAMNPIGCGGMMFTERKHHWFLMFLWKIMWLIILIVIYPIVLVFAMPVLITAYFFDYFDIGMCNEPDLDFETAEEFCDCCCYIVDCYGCD
jgi:hypothetical protein